MRWEVALELDLWHILSDKAAYMINGLWIGMLLISFITIPVSLKLINGTRLCFRVFYCKKTISQNALSCSSYY